MKRILIKGGTLYTMIGKDGIFKGDVLIEDGKIIETKESIHAEDAEVIDASGLCVMPGLIDAHSHIGLFDFNSDEAVDDANEMTDPVSAAVDARYGINPKARELRTAYEHGITSMLFTPGSGDVFCGQAFVAKTFGDNIFDMTVKAPAAVKIALGGNPKNTFGDLKRLPMTRMGVAHVLWDTFSKAKEYLEKKEKGEALDYDANMEALIPALKREIPCKIHCTQYDMLTAIEAATAYNVRVSLEHAWGAADYLDEIVESGCDICYGPIATYRAPGERRKVDIEAVKMLDDRDVNVAIITDSPILSEESLYHHIGEAVREGVSHERAVRMVTINPAVQLGLEERIGCLGAGRDADIILVKGRLGLDTNAAVMMTMVDGEIVYRA